MKRIYIFALSILLSSVSSMAQISVTNASFPVAGDTLKTSVDVAFTDFDPSNIGEDITWDFSGLTPDITTVAVYVDATTGSSTADYPDADLLQLGDGAGQDIYYKSSNNRITEEGRSGLDPVFQAIDLVVAVEGNAVFRRALDFGDTFDDQYGFSLEIAVSDLPDSIASLLGGLVSDIRVNVDFEINEEVDAWGNVILPDSEQFDVLRVNREIITNTVVEGKIFGTWIDAKDLPFTLPDFVLNLLEPTTTRQYVFVSNDAKEEVVNVLIDSTNTILSTTFKVNKIVTATNEVEIPNAVVGSAYPNPSYGNVTFSYRNNTSSFRVDVLDVLGRKVWSKKSNAGQQEINADLSYLRSGTYLYRIYDNSGHKIVTKRLMIIRP